MIIKVLGKVNRCGVSKKTGKPYNFDQYHYLGKERDVEGQASLQVNVSPDIIPISSVIIGHEYDFEFDQRGFCVAVKPVPAPIK